MPRRRCRHLEIQRSTARFDLERTDALRRGGASLDGLTPGFRRCRLFVPVGTARWPPVEGLTDAAPPKVGQIFVRAGDGGSVWAVVAASVKPRGIVSERCDRTDR